ncbi:unnamed protein product [Ectocarpus fasciculatus]
MSLAVRDAAHCRWFKYLVRLAVSLLVALPPSWSFKATTTAVTSKPSYHRRQQQQRQQQHHQQLPRVAPKRRRRRVHAHSMQCTAVTLAVCRSAVFDNADNFADDVGTAAAPPLPETPPRRHVSPAEGGGSSSRDGGAGVEGPAGSVEDSVVVLSDWLDESQASLGLPGLPGLGNREEHLNKKGLVEVVGSQPHDEEGFGDGSAPFRFQQLIQQMWATLSRGNQLEYLGKEGKAKVKQALSVLAAYSALREHPLQTGVENPQQAFSEMDFNSDGEVSFDEFVRWYSMSTALDEKPQKLPVPTDDVGPATSANPGDGGGVAAPEVAFTRSKTLLSTAGSRGSRLLADVEQSLALTSRQLGNVPAADKSPRSAAAPPADGGGSNDGVRAAAPAPGKAWLGLSAGPVATAGAGLGVTEEEKEAARERWLSGAAAEPGTVGSGADPVNDSAAKDLEKALEMLRVLVRAHADVDTLVAALASCIIRNPMGRYNLEVIEEQFGPIIRGIVEDRLLLERLPQPTSSTSYLSIQQSFGVKPVLDLDDHHAKLMRDYLVHSSRDARAVVVHMADLTCRLRDPSKTPAHTRHTLALEALQLYVPVSNALGLGSSFRELEELGYKTIFPQTYSNMALWHHDVMGKSHDIVREVKRRMLDALHAREDISRRVHSYRLEGRTKALVSTFRKVFRQNKRADDVHDIIGFRIIVAPKRPGTRARRTATASGGEAEEEGEGLENPGTTKRPGDARRRGGSKPARSLFTVKTFPPPYRDADSRLLHDVYEVLVGLFDEVPGRFKNYVDFPKKNGYRSVHTTVVHPTGIMMEFQVRTALMHAEAEGGSASHSLYKGDLDNPEEASVFRSKMTPDVLSPAHRQLPSKSKKNSKATEAATAIQPAADGTSGSPATNVSEKGHTAAAVPLLESKRRGKPGLKSGGERLTPASDLDLSNRCPEP